MKNIKKLREYYMRLLNLKFPESNIEDDELADFYSELAEADAYYAGLIEVAIKTNFENRENFNFDYLKKLRNKLDCIYRNTLSDADKNKYKECVLYFEFLERLPFVICH